MGNKTNTWKQRFSYVNYFELDDLPPDIDVLFADRSFTDQVSTQDTPGRDWRKMISDGFVTTSDMSVTRYTVQSLSPWFGERVQVGATGISRGKKRTYRVRGVIPYTTVSSAAVSGSVSASCIERAKNLAYVNYYSNIGSVISSMKAMTTLGEIGQTFRMIRNPLQGIRQLTSSYLTRVQKRGRKGSRRDRLSYVRDQWLETQYGILPLVSDVDSAIEAFYRSSAVRTLHEPVRGRGQSDETGSAGFNSYGVPHNCNLQIRLQRTAVAQHKIFGIIRSTAFGIDKPTVYGFRWGEFVPTLWNLLPWSFVVDYFTGLGNVFDSWSLRSFAPQAAVGTTVSSTIAEWKTDSWKKTSNDSGWDEVSLNLQPGQLTLTKQVISRGLTYGAPWVLPTFRVPGTGTKWINLAALSHQLISARRAIN